MNQVMSPPIKFDNYLGARKRAKTLGYKLMSLHSRGVNILFDHYVNGIYFSRWTDEIAAIPEKGKQFEKGRDIVDAQTGWTVPLKEALRLLNDVDIFQGGISLLITPMEVTSENGRTIIHPKSIIAMAGSISYGGECILHWATKGVERNALIFNTYDAPSVKPLVCSYKIFHTAFPEAVILSSLLTAYLFDSSSYYDVILEPIHPTVSSI